MWGKYAEVSAPTNAPESRSGPDAAGEVTVVDVVHSPEVLLPQQTTEIAGEEGILELPSTIEIRVMNDSSSTQQGKADENANGEMSLLYHQAALEVQTGSSESDGAKEEEDEEEGKGEEEEE